MLRGSETLCIDCVARLTLIRKAFPTKLDCSQLQMHGTRCGCSRRAHEDWREYDDRLHEKTEARHLLPTRPGDTLSPRHPPQPKPATPRHDLPCWQKIAGRTSQPDASLAGQPPATPHPQGCEERRSCRTRRGKGDRRFTSRPTRVDLNPEHNLDWNVQA